MELAILLSLSVAAVATGMVAGLFFVFSCAVMPALRRVSDPVFIEVMQRINVAILNGWFLLVFLGAPVATALTAVLALVRGERGILIPVVAALVLYLAMTAITRLFNIRMNDELDRSGPGGGTDPAAVRRRFEEPWTGWNTVRTLLSTASAACLAWTLALL
ncbi:hypothetical protein LP52_06320 [Streptomonospora alba]|uniref:DUF1772 domain-containing protein n=2 Tax=Streptomonospora alba TaxID=183763 RepID=A0A0C2JDP3_9ACTN|nr:hypothetical protein LP52_06320 [Streptomonospora alba]